MASEMSLPCPVCGAVPLIGGSGRRQAVAAVARHMKSAHPNLTEVEKSELARRLPPPMHFVDAVMAATASGID